MNETETNPSAENLQNQVTSLQTQVFLLLLALIVITATLVFYLYYQSRILGSDLEENRPRAMQVIQTFNANKLAIENLDKQLINYGATHPEFQPVLRKYGLMAPATTTAPRLQ
jgi:sensor histidine kinase regulating citrate/malate metabolism